MDHLIAKAIASTTNFLSNNPPELWTWFRVDESHLDFSFARPARVSMLHLPFNKTAVVSSYGSIGMVDVLTDGGLEVGFYDPAQSRGCMVAVDEDFVITRVLGCPDESASQIVSGTLAICASLAHQTAVAHQATPSPRNPARIKRGKKPLFEWRTVVIEPPALPNPPQGGHHATPRAHDRRGHWATSKLGKQFWRKQARIGNAAKGVIFHDYVKTA